MKQPEDKKTRDIIAEAFGPNGAWAPPGEKRGRGRPRVENPLSAAERAKRYREKKRLETSSRTRIMSIIRDEEPATKKNDEVWRLELEVQQLKASLESYRQFAEQRAELDDHAQRQFDDLQLQLKMEKAYVRDLVGALETVEKIAASGKRIPADVRKGLLRLLSR